MHTGFPLWADWPSLGLGVFLVGLGIALALPSLFQMYFGQPKVTLSFGVDTVESIFALVGEIDNFPPGKWARRIGVHRETEPSATAYITVFDQNNEKIGEWIPEIKVKSGEVGTRMPIVGDLWTSTFPVVFITEDRPSPILADRKKEKMPDLAPGRYKAEVRLILSDKVIAAEHEFIVNRPKQAQWTN